MKSPTENAVTAEILQAYRSPDALASAEQKMDLLEYWRSIRKRKWSITGLVLVVTLLAAIVAQLLTPIYRASATLLIEPGRSRIVSIDDGYAAAPGQAREGLLTQLEVLKSRDVIEGAVRKERLWEHPAYDPRKAAPSWQTRLAKAWGLSQPTAVWTEPMLVEGAVARARAELEIEGVGFSQLVRLSYQSTDPALAARMANHLADSYIADQRAVRLRAAQQANATLMESLDELKAKLTASEQALQSYRETRGLVNLGGSTLTLAGQKATAATESLSKARTRRLELAGAYSQVKAVANDDFTSVPWVMRDPAVQDAQRQVSSARRRLLELSQTLGSRNSKVMEAQDQLDDAETLIKRQSAAAADSLRREYEAALATEQALGNDLSAVRTAVSDINRDEFELAGLEREVATNRRLYDLFVTRGKETTLAGEVQGAAARTVEKAVAVASPIKPIKERIIGLAAVAAALLGAAVALLLDSMDNTLKGADDAETRLRLPLLVSLPILKPLEAAKASQVFLASPGSHYAEAIRTARTGVMLSNIDASHKTLLVTSSVPGEGKTTLAINLALAHAQTRRTLLIDADMRRPQIAARLGTDPAAKGLSNLVVGNGTIEECLQSLGTDSPLMILTGGDMPPNPLELLLSQRFDQVLAELQTLFDIIIIDSPPVGLVSDALVLAPRVTGTILVVKAQSTPAPQVRKTIASLQRGGARILGMVLNALDFSRANTYYGEHNAGGESYGYGYGSGYGSGSGSGNFNGYGQGKTGQAAQPATLAKPDVVDV